MEDKTETKEPDLKKIQQLIRQAKELIDENESAKQLDAMEEEIKNIK